MPMNTLKRRFRWLAGMALVVAGILFFYLPGTKNSAPLPVKWTPQPDSLPLGTVLQGATVEMSVGITSDQRPSQLPSWVSKLPTPISRWVIDSINRRRSRANERTWKIKVDAPDFLRVDAPEIIYQSWWGAFLSINLHLITDQPGSHDGALTVRLSGEGYVTNTVVIPIHVRVLAKSSRWAVLVSETPFERQSTGNGRDYEPLAAITTRLAEKDVRVDFRYRLPKSLDGWNVILIGGVTLSSLDADDMKRLQQFVVRGGRLIVSADAFFGRTAPRANDLINRYGLRIDTNDAGQRMQAVQIESDPLTAGVTKLSFYRPAFVWVTDSKQAKVLAKMKADDQPGFIAVSRAAGRGDVILLGHSLWYTWVKPEPGGEQNARMFENLLAP